MALIKDKHQSNLDFRFMAFFFKIRDLFKSPMIKINKAGVKKGESILDYGCGSGSYALAAANVVKDSGKVFAADIHPLAIKKLNRKIEKKDIKNTVTIETELDTGLKDAGIDRVLCFDMLHDVEDKKSLMEEFHRILKPNGILAFDDHHATETDIKKNITDNQLFILLEENDGFYIFQKN